MYSGFEIDRQPGDPAPFCVWLMFMYRKKNQCAKRIGQTSENVSFLFPNLFVCLSLLCCNYSCPGMAQFCLRF